MCLGPRSATRLDLPTDPRLGLVKSVEFSPLAREDFLGTYRQYLLDAGPEVANRFSDMVDQAVTTISESPGAGSLRYAEIFGVPGLRYIAPQRFPYLIFYVVDAMASRVLDIRRVRSSIQRGSISDGVELTRLLQPKFLLINWVDGLG